jgi:hypothetical protein
VVAIDVVWNDGRHGARLDYGEGVPLPLEDYETAERAMKEAESILSALRLHGALDAAESELPLLPARSADVRWTVEADLPHLQALGIKTRYVGTRFHDRYARLPARRAGTRTKTCAGGRRRP